MGGIAPKEARAVPAGNGDCTKIPAYSGRWVGLTGRVKSCPVAINERGRPTHAQSRRPAPVNVKDAASLPRLPGSPLRHERVARQDALAADDVRADVALGQLVEHFVNVAFLYVMDLSMSPELRPIAL